VIDGDTIDVRLPTGTERVRLIGIDTPEARESEHLDRQVRRSGRSRETILALGRSAHDFTRRLLAGRTVALESDVERRDRFDRTLAYVWLDDVLVNERIVAEGWATLLTMPPNVHRVEQLRAAEARARAARVGLWAGTTQAATPGTAPLPGGRCPDTHPVKGNVRSGARDCVFHVRGDEHYEATRAERCYATPADAVADGCRAARR
jgi:micrococcal nuclease